MEWLNPSRHRVGITDTCVVVLMGREISKA